jgi:hypothetical protein
MRYSELIQKRKTPGKKYAFSALFLLTQGMWKPSCCWSGNRSKSEDFEDLGRICGCAFVVVRGIICFRLPWWGKENERFGKRSGLTFNGLMILIRGIGNEI